MGLGLGPVQAGDLADRLANYPHWQGLPPTQVAQGDLPYPDWFEGDWVVTSTLMDLQAPLAPDLVSPGFESNRAYLGQDVRFPVRFKRASSTTPLPKISSFGIPVLGLPRSSLPAGLPVVADRQFNGEQIAQAYVGADYLQRVRVDPRDPNRQVTQFKTGLALVSVVTDRAWEWHATQEDYFVSTELSQQFFRGSRQVYFNRVETTTGYQYYADRDVIFATQITAIYLSPQDPNYFRAGDRPIALYNYHLTLAKSP